MQRNTEVGDSVSVIGVEYDNTQDLLQTIRYHLLKTGTVADFKEDNRSETQKLAIPCPFSGLLKTTPEIYCNNDP